MCWSAVTGIRHTYAWVRMRPGGARTSYARRDERGRHSHGKACGVGARVVSSIKAKLFVARVYWPSHKDSDYN